MRLAVCSCLNRENTPCSSLPVDLAEETPMVTLKIQGRTHKICCFWCSSPAGPTFQSVQASQRIPPCFHKGAPDNGHWRRLESVAEEASTLSLNLGHTTERSRKLVEGEERRRLSMLTQPGHKQTSKETFPLQCMNESAIENFSCVIYNICLMNCTWQAGRGAPADTQYFLYWQNSRDDGQMECELYIKDENGRNMGCRFQNVRIEIEKAYFLVNGSSKDSLIQFYDEYIELYKIEILGAPLNVTAHCTGDPAGCIITWHPPLTSHVKKVKCFQYEINIQNKDEPKEEKKVVRNERYEFQNYNEKKRYILKIRARGPKCLVSSKWGEWSEPIEFGQGKDYFIFVILFLIALGTISVTVLLYCLFKR
ncbi:PREDICTED: granulocyte-macrophage colony-stimulating factor receptor subunit alpha-like isoform X1 [Lepidothrix coronata]|uniref:Granulocyte-macrophage colony-stimulating factor receptor subunit alpha-like isoform X1 n=1 Tax=Lepidothrix coronata TaxID=321398 RepID=A0A6J0HDM0_9PASS|nr:PREDICTED: granulocyte-macrophage colony-stimulating factor receptor subunit alpha-like isoform X1 [Lepidothrix coronata]